MQTLLKSLLLICAFSYALVSEAQQSQDFGEYVVH